MHFIARFACIGLAALLASCGGGGGGSSPAPPPPPPPALIAIAVAGMAVVKVQANALGLAMMEQRLTALTEPGPDRALAIVDASGSATGRYTPPQGFALIDFAQHPSGEISVALATATTVRLARIDRAGTLALALRTGRNATIAYRFNHVRPGGFTRAWRTLAEPGFSVFVTGITSGTFDTFDALQNHWQLRMDADAAGNIAVGVVSRFPSAPLFETHSRFFGETTPGTNGFIVTRIAPDGSRLGATAVDTTRQSELHGLRISGDDVAAVGRVFTVQRADGGGWDAWSAHLSQASGALSFYRVLDVELGEILFDIAALPQGRFLVAGAAGYTQNPTGGSVFEPSTPLLAVLESGGTLRSRIAFAAGPRLNELRSLALLGNRWIVGGMLNGPGTHSGDLDRTLITADGFARETAVNP